MKRSDVYEKLKKVFEDVFDLDDVVLSDETTAQDIEGWDSLTHITLICEVEHAFNIKIPMKDVLKMKNVGEMVTLIMQLSV